MVYGYIMSMVISILYIWLLMLYSENILFNDKNRVNKFDKQMYENILTNVCDNDTIILLRKI